MIQSVILIQENVLLVVWEVILDLIVTKVACFIFYHDFDKHTF